MTRTFEIHVDNHISDNGENSARIAEPIEFNAIENAVNEAAKRINTIWLSLIFLMTYVVISTGKISHKD